MEKRYPGKSKPGLACCLTCEDSSDEEKVITTPPKSFDGYEYNPRVVRNNDATTEIAFSVNGKSVSVKVADVSSSLSLARFLRENLHLTGTKISCGQGGCGACIVTASIPNDAGRKVMSVNSCLTPVLSCDGWELTTVEGLGSRKGGLHPIQERLAAFHGTQCGFCSPGMVMQLNSLLSSKPNATSEEVEHILDGNLCRCTGYRPIFDAFKSFAVDAPENLKQKLADIEDLASSKKVCCQKETACTKGKLGVCKKSALTRFVTSDNGEWNVPTTIDQLIQVLDQIPSGKTHRLVGGNTGRGIYDPDTQYDVYIDVKKIPELSSYSVDAQQLQIGAATSLNALVEILEAVAQSQGDKYHFGTAMANHIKKVANTGVRNGGTIAGNLMLKHAYNDFPSDLFILFESISTKLVVKSSAGEVKLSPVEFLQHDMTKSALIRFEVPAVTSQHKFASYKITPRSENAHAYVNAACMAKLGDNFVLAEKPSLLFGGISATFFHAVKTEAFLVGKSLNDVQVIRDACAVLRDEVLPTTDPVLASVEYRKYLPQALFYKFVLSVLGDAADPKLRSGSLQILRGLSSGQQSYETDPSLYPVNKPIPKIESQSQCTGEAEYVDDIPPIPGELHAAFVLATIANCELDVVDPSPALAMPGVVAFYDHKAIAGKNSCVIYNIDEPIFSEGKIMYAGQAVGVIVAETADLARRAASAVNITYKNRQKPILTIREAIQDPGRVRKATQMPPPPNNIGADIIKVSGEFEIGSQYHFSMETQSVIVRPVEDLQYEILAACQWMDNVQIVVSQALAIPEGTIEVKVRRMGGAYGAKGRPPAHVAAAAAIAASKLNKPVRLIMDIKSNMELMGKRFPYLAKYNAGVTTDGKLLYVSAIIYCDCGFSLNESTSSTAAAFAKNCYKAVAWNIVPSDVLTNTPSHTYCRAPGTTQGVAIIENVMEHLATALGMDPLEFRVKNMIGTSPDIPNPLPEIIPQLRASSEYDQRKIEVENFNQNNFWKKRGIAFVPICYPYSCGGTTFYFHLSVYAVDGTIAISHGGTEMGQGINTKVVQTVAKQLGVSMETINVKPCNSFISPNTSATWGSQGTDCVCTAAIIACADLKERMGKVAESMDNPSWIELVQECYKQGVDLTARHMGYTDREGPSDYIIWSSVVTEVEIDVLTGEKNVRRVDLMEDTGTSISPEVDVGQLEGAFVMSLGLWLTEEIKYDPDTGRLLTFDTWEYKPPASHDIPEDLRTTFYDSKRNPSGVLGSKATGEPSVLMGVSALLAIRHAIAAAKKDLGEDPKAWFSLYGPATTERVQLTTGVKADHFRL